MIKSLAAAGTSAVRRRSWCFAAGVIVVAAVTAVFLVGHYRFVDTRIYLGALRWWTEGGGLYEFAGNSGLGFTYPPFAALLMLPFTWLSVAVMGWGTLVVSSAALAWTLVALGLPIADRYGWKRGSTLLVVLPIALISEPVRQSLGLGQVDVLLFALIVADLVAIRRSAPHPTAPHGTPVRNPGGLRRWYAGAWTWTGAGIGLAAAIKLTPALFILYLLCAGRHRAARTAIVVASAATLATALLAPRTTAQYFGVTLWQTDRVGRTDVSENQSLAGLLARLADSPQAPRAAWAALALVVLVIGLVRARRAHLGGDEVAAFTLVGLTANLVSPVSWTHHMLFLLPAIMILADTAWHRRIAARSGAGRPARAVPVGLVAAAIVFALTMLSPFWLFLHRLPQTSHYADGPLGVLAENAITLLLTALVIALPHRPGVDARHRVPADGHGSAREAQDTPQAYASSSVPWRTPLRDAGTSTALSGAGTAASGSAADEAAAASAIALNVERAVSKAVVASVAAPRSELSDMPSGSAAAEESDREARRATG